MEKVLLHRRYEYYLSVCCMSYIVIHLLEITNYAHAHTSTHNYVASELLTDVDLYLHFSRHYAQWALELESER